MELLSVNAELSADEVTIMTSSEWMNAGKLETDRQNAEPCSSIDHPVESKVSVMGTTAISSAIERRT
jgi:hypothetical protein